MFFFTRLALSGANAPALPKGEPLAKPEALHLNREVYRHAKGPIPEGAVAVGDWGSFNVLALSVTCGDSSPKGRALGSPRKVHLFAKASPFGRGGTVGDGEGEDATLCDFQHL